MKTKKLFVLFITLAMGILLVAGCSTTPEPSADPASLGPAWVMKGGGAFDVAKGKVFYGVGSAFGIRNKALLRQTADNRARADIAKTMQVYVATLAKDYMASTTAGDMSKSSEEQHVETALRTFSKATLHGAEIVERWMDPSDGTLYALCELDLFSFKDALEKQKELDKEVRDYVRENADKLHGEMEELENK